MMNLLLSMLLGLSAGIIVWTIFVLQKDLSPNTLRRLDRIKRKTNIVDGDGSSSNIDLIKEYSEYKFISLEPILSSLSFTKKIKNLLYLSDVKWHIDTFIIFSFACAAPWLICLFTPMKLFSFGGIITFFIPTIYLNNIINQRFVDFSKQFPDALNLMASSLRAGHPLFSALNIVTDEMPKPISDVFATAQKDISLGVDTKDAFLSMTKIMPQSIDLKFFITAVLIQKEVGGNLAELLDSLSITIRERFKLLGQLRVQTAQTRISGLVLSIVPPGLAVTIFFMNPSYIEPLFKTPDGRIALAIAIIMMVLGIVISKKVSEIEI